MAFLRLNGITIPVATGRASLDRQDIGSRTRAYDGTLLVDRIATKRRWQLKTKPLDETEANAVEGIIRGDGHVFHYNDGATVYSAYEEVDEFSAKGLAPAAALGAGFFKFNVPEAGAGSTTVLDVNDEPEAQFLTSGCLENAAAVTNLAAANVSDGTDTSSDTTGWTDLGGGIASSTTHAMEGSRCLNATIAAGNDGARCSIACSTTTEYTASAYIYINSGPSRSCSISLVGDSSGAIANTTKTLTGSQWYRLEVTGTTNGADATLYVDIESQVAAGFNIFIDCVQIETGARATPWKHSSGARSAGDLDYGSVMSTYNPFTINAWVKGFATPPGGRDFIYIATNAGITNYHFISYESSGNLRFAVQIAGVLDVDIDVASSTFDDTWHMVTAVFNQAADGSTYNKAQLFEDGVSVGTDNTIAGTFDPSDLTILDVGHSAGAGHFEGSIEDFQILPYAMTPTQVAALYAMGNTDAQGMSDLPKLFMDGDIVQDSAYGVTVQGRITGVDYVQTGSVAAWENNRRIISFELEEV